MLRQATRSLSAFWDLPDAVQAAVYLGGAVVVIYSYRVLVIENGLENLLGVHAEPELMTLAAVAALIPSASL